MEDAVLKAYWERQQQLGKQMQNYQKRIGEFEELLIDTNDPDNKGKYNARKNELKKFIDEHEREITSLTEKIKTRQSEIQALSEPDKINSEIVPVEQKPSEAEEQVIDLLTQEIPVLEVVVDQPIIPKQQVPELKKEINALNKDIQHCLRSLNNSELKRILTQNSPYPQLFKKIDSNPIVIQDILIRFKNTIKRCNGKIEQIVLLDKSYKLANKSSELLDNCFQKISILKKCKSNKASLYIKVLSDIKHLFNQIEQNLLESSLYLEQSLFF